MSSIIDAYQRSYEAIAADQDLAVATPFTAMHLQQKPMIDFGTDQVTIEVYKGNRKVAPLVSRRTPGSDIDDTIIRPGVSGANDYLFALIQQELQLNAGELNKRIPGETPFTTGNADDIKMMRQRFWMMKMAMDATKRILTRNELLAIQSYFEAEQNIGDTFQGATKLVFPRSSTLKNRTVSVSWAAAATAAPWTDYGNAQKEIKSKSQIDGKNVWISFLPSAAMENLKAVYRSQRAAKDTGPNLEYNEFKFNPEQEVPQGFQFLIDNGMEYNGWIRSDYSNSRIHLFTLPEGYDSTADDSAETYTDFLSGNTVSLCLFSPSYFKAYFGPGKKNPPSLDLYQRILPAMDIPSVSPAGLTLGTSFVPARTMLLNLFELGKNEGFGGVIEHAPIFANIRPDVVATIATTTTA